MTLKHLVVDPRQPSVAQSIFEAVLASAISVASKSYPHPHYGRPGKRGGSTSRQAYAVLEKEGKHWVPKRRGMKPVDSKDKDKDALKPTSKVKRKTHRGKPKPPLKVTQNEPGKPAVKTAEVVRKEVLNATSGELDKLNDLQKRKESLWEQHKRLKKPIRSRYSDMSKYIEDYNGYVNSTNALAKQQREVVAEMESIQSSLASRVRSLLYVERPSQVNVSIKRTFPSKKKLQSVMDAASEFSKLVGVPIRENTIDILASGKTRAHYKLGSKTIHIGGSDGARVVIHEMGHWLEDSSPEILTKATNFLNKRTEGDASQSLRLLTGARYRSGEYTKPDKFVHPYIGKSYRSGGRITATEVISMGLEYMYAEPWKLASEDPDMFDFVYNAVRGQ